MVAIRHISHTGVGADTASEVVGKNFPIDEEQRSQKATKCISIIAFLGRKMKLGKCCQS